LEGNAEVKIYQDVNIFVCELEAQKKIEYSIQENRQIYFVQIEGKTNINGIKLNNGDAMEITQESNISIKALTNVHFLFIEVQCP